MWFVLDLSPEPWAIGPVGYSRRGGKMSAYVGQNQQLNAYEEAVAESVRDQLPDDFKIPEGKMALTLFFWRNRAEYTTPAARTHRKHEADATNMQKATEDALQGVLYNNDKDNLVVASVVMAQGPEVIGKVVIHLELLSDSYSEEVWSTLPPDIRLEIAGLEKIHTAHYVAPVNDYGDDKESF